MLLVQWHQIYKSTIWEPAILVPTLPKVILASFNLESSRLFNPKNSVTIAKLWARKDKIMQLHIRKGQTSLPFPNPWQAQMSRS